MTVAEMATLYEEVKKCKDGLRSDLSRMRNNGEETICFKDDHVERLIECLMSVDYMICNIANNTIVPGTESR